MQTLPSQLPFATDYFRQLGNLSESFEATDKKSQPLSFAEAISRAAALVSQQSQQQKKVIFIGNGGVRLLLVTRQLITGEMAAFPRSPLMTVPF